MQFQVFARNKLKIISYFLKQFIEYNNKVYFQADAFTGWELFVTDGTELGTYLVKDINTVSSSNPANFTIYNNRLYFSADDNQSGDELWTSDGTDTGTYLVSDISSVFGGSYPLHFMDYGWV